MGSRIAQGHPVYELLSSISYAPRFMREGTNVPGVFQRTDANSTSPFLNGTTSEDSERHNNSVHVQDSEIQNERLDAPETNQTDARTSSKDECIRTVKLQEREWPRPNRGIGNRAVS